MRLLSQVVVEVHSHKSRQPLGQEIRGAFWNIFRIQIAVLGGVNRISNMGIEQLMDKLNANINLDNFAKATKVCASTNSR